MAAGKLPEMCSGCSISMIPCSGVLLLLVTDVNSSEIPKPILLWHGEAEGARPGYADDSANLSTVMSQHQRVSPEHYTQNRQDGSKRETCMQPHAASGAVCFSGDRCMQQAFRHRQLAKLQMPPHIASQNFATDHETQSSIPSHAKALVATGWELVCSFHTASCNAWHQKPSNRTTPPPAPSLELLLSSPKDSLNTLRST